MPLKFAGTAPRQGIPPTPPCRGLMSLTLSPQPHSFSLECFLKDSFMPRKPGSLHRNSGSTKEVKARSSH